MTMGKRAFIPTMISPSGVKGLLAGVPTKRLFDHMTAVESLKPYVGQDVLAYDLLLFARMWFADHSQDEIGSTVVLGVFRKYLEYAGGKYAIIFLRSRLTGTDQVVANLAARIIADLLDLQSTPEAKKYRGNYAALRQMAMENGWEKRVRWAPPQPRRRSLRLSIPSGRRPTGSPW